MLAVVHSTPIRSAELDAQGADEGASHPDIQITLAAPRAMWVDGLGGLVVIPNSGGIYLVKLDGTAVCLSKSAPGVAWNGIGWSAQEDAPVLAAGGPSLWTRAVLPSAAPFGAKYAFGGASLAVLQARVLSYVVGVVVAGAYGADRSTGEATLEGTSDSGIMAPARARPCDRWWCLTPSSGRCHLYDSTSRTVVGQARIAGGWLAAGYSRKHNVFVALYGPAPYTLKVYANEPAPASVTPPVFSAGPRRGALATLSAQVLGADGEPCVGHVVEFAVTAGTVTPAAAATDVTGTAAVSYRAPLAAVDDASATATLDEG